MLDLLPGSGHGTDHAVEGSPGDAAAQRPDGRLDQYRESVDAWRTADHDEKGKGEIKMKVLVYGSGVIGCYLAHVLCTIGNDVTLLTRGSWKE